MGISVVIILLLEFGGLGKKFSRVGNFLGFGRLEVGSPAPGFEGGGQWLNSGPLSIDELRGKVVLVEFWTFSSVECVGSLQHLNRWRRLYGPKGFEVIGVHSPEFEFEGDPENLRTAVKRLGVTYPVVADNDMRIWSAYKNKFWPHRFLIDVNGIIRYHFIGNGSYTKAENAIIELLNETGALLPYLPPEEVEEATVFGMPRLTPLIYFGRGGYNYFGNFKNMGSREQQVLSYPAEIEPGYFYLSGEWELEKEYITNKSAAAAGIMIVYNAESVNLTAGLAEGRKSGILEVLIDNGSVNVEDAGDDLLFDDRGRSYVKIEDSRMYNLLKHPYGLGTHTIELLIESQGVRMYTLSFES